MTRYVLRNGEVVYSRRLPDGLDVYCYQTGYNHHTCLMLSDQAEADFLINYGTELNVRFAG